MTVTQEREVEDELLRRGVEQEPPITAAEHAARCAAVDAWLCRLRQAVWPLVEEACTASSDGQFPPVAALAEAIWELEWQIRNEVGELWQRNVISTEHYLWHRGTPTERDQYGTEGIPATPQT